MTRKEARDDERKALIADAKDFVDSWDHLGSWTADSPVGMIARLAMALEAEMDRKHPEPEITDEMVERAAEALYTRTVECMPTAAGAEMPQWNPELGGAADFRCDARATLEAALWVPAGEGDQ